MKLPVIRKKKDEDALINAGDCWVWAELHLKLACPHCTKLFEPTGAALTAKSISPLTIDNPIKCPHCAIEFRIRNETYLIDEPPLPPLDENFCFIGKPIHVIPHRINVVGSPANRVGNCPPLCIDCFASICQGTAEATGVASAIRDKAADYNMQIHFS